MVSLYLQAHMEIIGGDVMMLTRHCQLQTTAILVKTGSSLPKMAKAKQGRDWRFGVAQNGQGQARSYLIYLIFLKISGAAALDQGSCSSSLYLVSDVCYTLPTS